MHRRRVVGDRITYVGLDVHKEGIVVAVAEGGIRGEVREYGRIANTAGALDRLMRKLGGEGVGLRFCYKAGPCGYGIQRHLSAHRHDCVVVAPSLIPKRAGDRVKTDRRDAASLARLHRAGELTAVWGRRQRTTGHAAAGQRWGRGRGQENPRNHYLPDRRSDAGF
jgi:transposase